MHNRLQKNAFNFVPLENMLLIQIGPAPLLVHNIILSIKH
jgi:hypothetical protein